MVHTIRKFPRSKAAHPSPGLAYCRQTSDSAVLRLLTGSQLSSTCVLCFVSFGIQWLAREDSVRVAATAAVAVTVAPHHVTVTSTGLTKQTEHLGAI